MNEKTVELLEIMEEAKDVVDRLNGALHDFLDEYDNAEHSEDDNVANAFTFIQEFFMKFPTYSCLEELEHPIHVIEESGSEGA